MTPKYANHAALDSPMEEPPDPMVSLDEAVNVNQIPPDDRPPTVTPSDTMRPPPLPAHILQQQQQQNDDAKSTPPPTTPEEARRALAVVLTFFEQQPHGFLDLQESVTIGKLMEKLKLHSRGGS